MEAKEVSVDGMVLTKERLNMLFNANHMPEHMEEGLYLYLTYRIPPGSFMLAVLSNDLIGAAQQADHINKNALFKWANFMYNFLPGKCYGSKENVQNWLKGV
jgi:hypothetical protein